MKLTKSQLKELIRHTIVDLTEKTFGSKAQYDAYRKKHNLKPGSKHKVAGKTVTVRDTKKMSKKAKSLGDRMADKLNKRMADLEKKRKKSRKKDDEYEKDRKYRIGDLGSLGVAGFDESIKESKKRRYTVKEVRMWMKKLEENRYKKVYNSDARRVAWMVNNEGRTLDEMPMSMKKKWSKAQYGRERYLATEFLKSKSEQLSEGLDLKKLETAIKDFQNKIKKQGRVTNARDEEHLKQLIKVYKQMGGKKIKEQKLRESIREIIEEMDESLNFGKVMDKYNKNIVDSALSMSKKHAIKDKQRGSKQTPKLIAIKTINRMKEYRNKTKGDLKLMFQKTIDKLEKDYKKIKEQMNEAYRSQSIFFDKKDKSKLQKLLKKNKGKFPFNPFGEPVVNWSLDDRGSKGIEWSGIPKYNYDKAVEFFMKNKLNPRG